MPLSHLFCSIGQTTPSSALRELNRIRGQYRFTSARNIIIEIVVVFGTVYVMLLFNLVGLVVYSSAIVVVIVVIRSFVDVIFVEVRKVRKTWRSRDVRRIDWAVINWWRRSVDNWTRVRMCVRRSVVNRSGRRWRICVIMIMLMLMKQRVFLQRNQIAKFVN